jgi:hypothetical protein
MTGWAQRTVIEKRAVRSLHTTLYAMAVCPLCHAQCAQKRGGWTRANGHWTEDRQCKRCEEAGRESGYQVRLLPCEIERAERGQRHA